MKRKVLLLGVAVLLAVGAQAQTTWGVKAGVTMPKINYGIKGLPLGMTFDSPESNVSFYATGFADIALSKKFSLQPGLSYQGKGGKTTTVEEDETTKLVTNFSYIEVPVNLVYYIKAGDGKIFLGAGPYVAYGIAGNRKTNKEKSEKISWGNDKDVKPLDIGLNTMFGYKLSGGFLINMGYGMGFSNTLTKDDVAGILGFTAKNRVLSAGIGYNF